VPGYTARPSELRFTTEKRWVKMQEKIQLKLGQIVFLGSEYGLSL